MKANPKIKRWVLNLKNNKITNVELLASNFHEFKFQIKKYGICAI